MDDCIRQTPVTLPVRPVRSEERRGFRIVLEYEGEGREGQGPCLVDLSHRPKWDLQARNPGPLQPWGCRVPDATGISCLSGGWLVSRQRIDQAAFWHLGKGEPPPPEHPGLTDVTDARMLVALIGSDALAVMEKVSSLDLGSPNKEPPFLLQGPLLHVPCQVVLLSRDGEGTTVLLSCSRGYGQSMSAALLDAGKPWDLRPAGEEAFTRRLPLWETAG